MPCHDLAGGGHICTGPTTERVPTGRRKSASHCGACKRRRVLELVAHVPTAPSYYGSHYTWQCVCGWEKIAREYGEE